MRKGVFASDGFPMENKIRILAAIDSDETLSAFPKLSQGREIKVFEVPSADLADKLALFLSDFQRVLEPQPSSFGSFEIDEVELNLTVNAKGGIELIGTLGVGMESSIKIKLRRKK